jgi:hypothetical protein
VWRPLLPRLGCLLVPRRSSPASWAASASPCFLERRVRRRLWPPRVAFSTLPRDFLSLIAWFLHNVVLSFAVLWIPRSSCHSRPFISPPFSVSAFLLFSCNPKLWMSIGATVALPSLARLLALVLPSIYPSEEYQ